VQRFKRIYKYNYLSPNGILGAQPRLDPRGDRYIIHTSSYNSLTVSFDVARTYFPGPFRDMSAETDTTYLMAAVDVEVYRAGSIREHRTTASPRRQVLLVALCQTVGLLRALQ